MYFYTNKDGDVKMYSESRITAPNLIEHVIAVTPEEQAKFDFNPTRKIKDGKLEIGEPHELKSGEQESRKNLIKDLKTEIEKLPKNKTLTVSDFKDILDLIST